MATEETITPESETVAAAGRHLDAIHEARGELDELVDRFPDFKMESRGAVGEATLSDLEAAARLLAEANTRLDMARDREGLPLATAGEPDTDRFAVPDMIEKYRVDVDRWAHDARMAALDHAKHLQKAEGRLSKAYALAETLRCALKGDDYDPEAIADDGVAEIINLLNEAQAKIDRHSRRHSNLFLAYFDRDRQSA